MSDGLAGARKIAVRMYVRCNGTWNSFREEKSDGRSSVAVVAVVTIIWPYTFVSLGTSTLALHQYLQYS